jgi:hypothetical protein
MTEIEDKRFMRRFNVFVAEGLSEDESSELAYSMMTRDRDTLDDRRVCFECQNLVDNKLCANMKDRLGKMQIPLRFILQRCDNFKLKETK